MSDAFDEVALMERVDDDIEFLEETISMLAEDSPALLEQIRTAVAVGDAAALVKPAHAIKGMLANFCAPSSEAAARKLETMGREERLTDAESAVDSLSRETERLLNALHQFVRARKQ